MVNQKRRDFVGFENFFIEVFEVCKLQEFELSENFFQCERNSRFAEAPLGSRLRHKISVRLQNFKSGIKWSVAS